MIDYLMIFVLVLLVGGLSLPTILHLMKPLKHDRPGALADIATGFRSHLAE